MKTPTLALELLDRIDASWRAAKQQLKEKPIEHKQYIEKYGQDLPEIRNWKWRS